MLRQIACSLKNNRRRQFTALLLVSLIFMLFNLHALNELSLRPVPKTKCDLNAVRDIIRNLVN